MLEGQQARGLRNQAVADWRQAPAAVASAALGADMAAKDTGEIGNLLTMLNHAIGACIESASRLDSALAPILDQRPTTQPADGQAGSHHPPTGSQTGERLLGMLLRAEGLAEMLDSLRRRSAL